MNAQLILTSDNSHSIYLPELDETYHSQHGALAESQHVYIQAGLMHVAQTKDSIKIFEFGLGTGLNALLTWQIAEEFSKKVVYDSVEKFPLPAEVYSQLNYESETSAECKLKIIHSSGWNETHILSPCYVFQKAACDVLDFAFPDLYYDLVYYDAFGPSKQSEVWEMPVLEKVCQAVVPNGVLVTYCSQGQFRRNLKELGFEIEKLAGPKGKREITRATKIR